MSTTLACPNCAHKWKETSGKLRSKCPSCGLVVAAQAGEAAASADRRLVKRQILGSFFAVLALVSFATLAFLVALFFLPRDARYSQPIIVVGSVVLVCTAFIAFTAYRLFAQPSGKTLWPLSLLCVGITLVIILFFATLSH